MAMCEECKYHHPCPESPGRGTCRIYPPRLALVRLSRPGVHAAEVACGFPRVYSVQSACGEFKSA